MISYTRVSFMLHESKDPLFVGEPEKFLLAARPDKVFLLGCGDFQPFMGGHGLCIGISLKHSSANDSRAFYENILNSVEYKEEGKVMGLLEGNMEGSTVSIPILVHDANSYIEHMGTSCLFGYVGADVIAPDERPRTGQFGHVVAMPELHFGGKDEPDQP